MTLAIYVQQLNLISLYI